MSGVHITRFIDKIKSLESKKAKQMTLSIQEAKDLHGDITKLLLALEELHQRSEKAEEVTEVRVEGGTW